MEENIDFKEKIRKLKEQVNKFDIETRSKPKQNIQNIQNIPSQLQSPFVKYILIFIVIFILQLVFKPKIIMSKIEVDGDTTNDVEPVYKLDYKKIFLSTILLTGSIILAYFIYNYKTKSKPSINEE